MLDTNGLGGVLPNGKSNEIPNGNGLRKRIGNNVNTEINDVPKTNGHLNGVPNRRKSLPEIEFVERESLLTQMFQVKEFRGLYNIFLVILINLTIYTIAADLVQIGTINLGFQNIQASFGKPLKTASLLLTMHLATLFLIYPAFALWAKLRTSSKLLTDFIFSSWILFVGSCFICIPVRIQWDDPFPVASGAIIVVEQARQSVVHLHLPKLRIKILWKSFSTKDASFDSFVKEGNVRLFMKMYAFLRTCIARVVVAGNKSQAEILPMPTYANYSYYLYAPTLLYRDSYPRTKVIRWDFIIRNVIELFGCIFVYNLLHQICGYVLFEKIGMPGEKMSTTKVLQAVFFQMIPGGVGWLLGFFILLHTSQNIAAELLRFADRHFYKDWWNCSSYSSFYRNWNLPVHHFLYTYIYRDARNFFFNSKTAPTICVFLVSAIVHEYVLIFVLRFFYPVLLVFFGGFGLTLNFIHTSESSGNTFIWWSLITGKALLLFFYSLEYFARLNNCPAAESPILDFLIPRSWTCGIFNWD